MSELDTSANAFDAVQKASAYATAQARGTAAYNALNTAYGPAIANDPAAAFNAAKASVAQQTIPTQVAQDQANLTTTQDTNTKNELTAQQMAAYRGAAMLAQSANPDGSISPDAYDKIVRPNAQLFGIDPAHVDQFGQLLQTPQGQGGPSGVQHLQGIMQTMMGPTKVSGATQYGVDAQGNPVAITKDQYGNIHQQSLNGTVTTAQQNADTGVGRLDNTVRHQGVTEGQGAQRVGIASFNAQSGRMNANANAFGKNTAANNTAYGNPSGMLPQGGNALPAPSTDLIHAGNPPGSTTAPAGPAPALTGKPLSTRTGMAQTVQNANTNYAAANSVINQLMTQANGYTTGAGSWGDFMRGSKAADLRANVEALQGQVGNAIINSMKNSQGQMGFRMTQTEFKTLTNSLGALDRDQSPTQFKYHVALVKQSLDKFNQTMNGGFRQQFGTDPSTALGQSSPALPGGWKYLGTTK